MTTMLFAVGMHVRMRVASQKGSATMYGMSCVCSVESRRAIARPPTGIRIIRATTMPDAVSAGSSWWCGVRESAAPGGERQFGLG